MTVNSTSSVNIAAATGTQLIFAYTFKVYYAAEIRAVLRNTTTGVESVVDPNDYVVSGVGLDGGGNVTFDSPPASGQDVMIRRYTPFTQITALRNQEIYRPGEVEKALDTLLFQIQRLNEGLERTIQAPESQTVGATTLDLPQASLRANKYISFDGSGNLIMMDGTDGGGGGTDSFVTVVGDSGTNPVAGGSDTLNLVGGTGVATVGNATSDTVTFDAVPSEINHNLLLNYDPDCHPCIDGTVVVTGSWSFTTPTITNFTNSQHDHLDADDGGLLSAGAIASGTFPTARYADDSVTYAKIQDVTTNSRVLGRISGGAGIIEELTQAQLTSLVNVFTTTINGAVPHPAGATTTYLRADGTWATPGGAGSVALTDLTDVTIEVVQTGHLLRKSSGGDWLNVFLIDTDIPSLDTAKITTGTFASARIADGAITLGKMADLAQNRIIGRVTGSTGAPESLTAGQAITVITSASGGGTANYLRADGTWATPPGGGGGDALVANPLSQFAATTSAQLRGVMSDETGTGLLYFQSGDLGTPSAGVATNLTGTAAGLTAGTVTTNANLTGVVTSTGNATAIANGAITNAMLANGAVANLSGTNSGNVTLAGTPDYITISGQVITRGLIDLATDVTGLLPVAGIANVATDVFLGRDTAASGPIEEMSVATAKTLLGLTGTNSGDQTITLTGNVTGSGTGSFAATIADNAVTYAKMQNVAANNSLLARFSGAGGDVEEAGIGAALTFASSQLRTVAMTGDVTTAANSFATTIAAGAVDIAMLSASGTPSATTFLRGDNTWNTPAGGGNVSNSGTPVDNQLAVWTAATVLEGHSGLTWDGTTLEATQFGGILNANLVDKSAAETIIGLWTMDALKVNDDIIFEKGTYDGTLNVEALSASSKTWTLPDLNGVVTVLGNAVTGTGAFVLDNAPAFTGDVTLENQKALRLAELTANGSLYVGIRAAAQTTETYTLTLPAAGPNATQLLQSDTDGNLSWINTPTGSGDALVANPLSQFAATTSAQLRGVMSDETGTGLLYFQSGDLGTPTAGVATNLTGTAAGLTAGNVTTNANLTGPVTSTGNATAIANGAITNAMLANGAVANLSGTNSGNQTITLTGDVTGTGTGSFAATIAAGAVDIAMLSATGTPSSTTFLRGDNTWNTPAGGGNVSNSGTPADNQLAVWTSATVIEGHSGLTWDGTTLEATQFGGILNANLVDKSAAETIIGDWTWSGALITDDSTTTRAGFRIPTGVAPTSPVQGDMWVTATDAFIRINGVSTSLITGGAGDALIANPLSQFAATSSAQLRGVISDESGTGLLLFQSGDLGTPTAGVATNLTGTASGLTAGTVTTNANLTGPVTSTGNATAIANATITNAMLVNGAVANLSGTNSGDQTITLTGDVTGTGTGSFAATIAANAVITAKLPDATTTTDGVTNAKLAWMPANTIKVNATGSTAVATNLAMTDNSILMKGLGSMSLLSVSPSQFVGRGSSGDIAGLSATNATEILNLFSTTLTTKGLVPGSNNVGATNFLNATGVWSVPSGGSGLPTTGGTMTGAIAMDNQMSVQFREVDGSGDDFAAIRGPSAITTSYTIDMPDAAPTTDDVWKFSSATVGAFGKILTANIANSTSGTDGVTNAKLAHMGPYSIKVRNAGTSGDPSDFAFADHSLLTKGTGALNCTLIEANELVFRGGTIGIEGLPVAASRLVGRAASGDISALTLTAPLIFTGSALDIDLFATGGTTKGVVPGSNSLGASYYLNGSGAWTIPAGVAPFTSDLAITANTTVQSTATQLLTNSDFELFEVTVVTGANNAVKLPTPTAGMRCVVANKDTADVLQVFPISGGKIDQAATNAAVTIDVGQSVLFVGKNSTDWLTMPGYASSYRLFGRGDEGDGLMHPLQVGAGVSMLGTLVGLSLSSLNSLAVNTLNCFDDYLAVHDTSDGYTYRITPQILMNNRKKYSSLSCEFMTLNSTTVPIFNDFHGSINAGGIFATVANAAANEPGVVRLSASAIADRCSVGTASTTAATSATVRLGGGKFRGMSRVKMTNISTNLQSFGVIMGLSDDVTVAAQFGAGASANGDFCGFVLNDALSAGAWTCRCKSNGTATDVNTGVVAANTTWYTLEFEVNAAGTSVSFWINGTSYGPITTNIPAASGREMGIWPVSLLKTFGGTARTIDIDVTEWMMQFDTPR